MGSPNPGGGADRFVGPVQRAAPGIHVLIPDTSILFCHEKDCAVEPEFDRIWDGNRAEFQLELRIPQTVRGELSQQHARFNCNLLKKANDALSKIERNTGKRYKHRATDGDLEQLAKIKIDQWITNHAGQVLITPYNQIDWAEIEDRAIRRIPPFSPDDKSGPTEKGFRDALILETLKHYCRSDLRDVQIQFLCADSLLRETAERELRDDKRVSCYESIEQLSAYFELTRQNLTSEFVRAIVGRAQLKFFDKEAVSGLYYSEDVKGRMRNQYGQLINVPTTWTSPPDQPQPDWQVKSDEIIDNGVYYIASPLFQAVDEDGWYVWNSQITFVRKYKRRFSILAPQNTDAPIVHFVKFNVVWRSRISTNGRFTALELLDVVPRSADVRQPTKNDIEVYHLQELTAI